MWKIDSSLISSFVATMQDRRKTKSYFNLVSKLKIANRKDIKTAVEKVYIWGVPFKIFSSYKKSGFTKNIDDITDALHNYFNKHANTPNNQNTFDIFHKKLCDLFKNGNSYTYGNAQKHINMIFKYLTTFSDYNKFDSLFSYCHMPIDRTILKIFSGVVKGCSNGAYNGTPWTSLTETQYKDLLDEYRKSIKKNSQESFLSFEYRCWAIKKLPPILTKGVRTRSVNRFYM